MEECGLLPQIFPEETLRTASWLWTVTPTPHTFRNHVGRCRRRGLWDSRAAQSFDDESQLKPKKMCIWIVDFVKTIYCCRIQVFHCLKHEGSGGRTLLVDGFHAAEKVRQNSPENFELLANIPIRHEYVENTGDHRNHMTGIGPVLNVYPWNSELYLIRYVWFRLLAVSR